MERRASDEILRIIKDLEPQATLERIAKNTLTNVLDTPENAALRKRLAQGVTTPNDVVEVGRIVQQRINAFENDAIAEAEYDFSHAVGRAQTAQEEMEKTGVASSAFSMRWESFPEYKPIRQAYLDALNARTEAKRVLDAIQTRARETVLAEIRPFGRAVGRFPLAKRVGGKSAEALTAIRDVERFMPTSWLKASDKWGEIEVAHVPRGFYRHSPEGSSYASVMTLSGDTSYTRGLERVALHEYTHRMSCVVPGVGDMERAYFNQRTAGESLVHIPGHDPDEFYKADNWTVPYMGKEYGPTTGREVLTMAHEGRAAPEFSQYKVGSDPESDQFLLGVLVSF